MNLSASIFSRRGLVTSTAAALALCISAAPPAAADTYKIDPAHTEVGFKVRHLGVSSVSGAFKDLDGTFTFDPKDIKASTVKAQIKTPSVDTGVEKRDTHLKSDDFFAAEKFPEITFVSKEIKDVKGDTFTVVGDLTIHGTTKSVELMTTYNGAVKDPWGNEKAGFSAETKINRKDFGLKYNQLLESGGMVVGDEVKITLEVEGTKQAS